MTTLTASEPSLLASKRKSTNWAGGLLTRLMNVTATALSFLQQNPRKHIERVVDDHKLHNRLRYEVMRHKARRLL